MTEMIQRDQISASGHFMVGGCDCLDLAATYGTPVIAYDVSRIRRNYRAFRQAFEKAKIRSVISYASKAFSCKAVYNLIDQEGGHVDVVSGGELATALAAGFPPERISFHGNNKSQEELAFALKSKVGLIIIDNFHEIELLQNMLPSPRSAHRDQVEPVHIEPVHIMLRITPGVSAHTHDYISTGQTDSKFGFDLASGQADRALQKVLADSRFCMEGIHAHIGSQIFDPYAFQALARIMINLAARWRRDFGYCAQSVNLGGGFGIAYNQEDDPDDVEDFVQSLSSSIRQAAADLSFPLPTVWIEPGRSLVGSAACTLYTVGSRKDIPGYNSYIFVDGGMGDNIRPALYRARYQAFLAKNPVGRPAETVRIAGKYCESGDVLCWDQALPQTQPGDILAIPATGAYGYSMASNYNRNPRPAVVFVEDGHPQLVIRRESYEDLIRLDMAYDSGPHR